MATYNKKRIDKQQLKEKVAQVAAVAFMHKGIKNVKMDDVAAELGISKRTLYELFSDKEELLLDVVKLHRKEMKNYMISVAEKAENVLEIIMSFYIRTTEDFQTTNILFFEEISDPGNDFKGVKRYITQNFFELVRIKRNTFA